MRTKTVALIFLLLTLFSTLSQGADLERGIYELNRGEFHAAIEQFRPLVAEGYAPAQYQMGTVYQKGYGVPKDAMKALELFELAAKQNDSDAQFELALIYGEGKLVKKRPIFKAEQIVNFLENADDVEFEQHKLAVIIGCAGCFRAVDYTALYHKKSDLIKIEFYQCS